VLQRRATLNSPASDFHSAIIHRTCLVHTGQSSEPAEQRLFRANGRLQRIKCAPTRAEEQSTRGWHTGQSTGLVRCTTGQPGGPTCQNSNGRNQRPGDVAGTPDSVRWRTRLSGAPCDSSLHQTASLVVGVINTPQPPHIQVIQVFTLPTTYKS
jgi:hypothetical protein